MGANVTAVTAAMAAAYRVLTSGDSLGSNIDIISVTATRQVGISTTAQPPANAPFVNSFFSERANSKQTPSARYMAPTNNIQSDPTRMYLVWVRSGLGKP